MVNMYSSFRNDWNLELIHLTLFGAGIQLYALCMVANFMKLNFKMYLFCKLSIAERNLQMSLYINICHFA